MYLGQDSEAVDSVLPRNVTYMYFHLLWAHWGLVSTPGNYSQDATILPCSRPPPLYQIGSSLQSGMNKLWGCIWSDMTIEPVLMRAMTVYGVLTISRNLTGCTLAKWVHSLPP